MPVRINLDIYRSWLSAAVNGRLDCISAHAVRVVHGERPHWISISLVIRSAAVSNDCVIVICNYTPECSAARRAAPSRPLILSLCSVLSQRGSGELCRCLAVRCCCLDYK